MAYRQRFKANDQDLELGLTYHGDGGTLVVDTWPEIDRAYAVELDRTAALALQTMSKRRRAAMARVIHEAFAAGSRRGYRLGIEDATSQAHRLLGIDQITAAILALGRAQP